MPIPCASEHQSRFGSDKLSSFAETDPTERLPVRCISVSRTRYARLAKITNTIFRCSLAAVHNPWRVYIAAPSPFNEIILRSGHATAAPIETGMPWPIPPPVSISQSCGRADWVAWNTGIPDVTASSDMIEFSGIWRAIEIPAEKGVNFPVGASGNVKGAPETFAGA